MAARPTLVVVEGDSDASAVATLAGRCGLTPDLVRPVVAHGVTNFARVLADLEVVEPAIDVVGLYDDREEHVVRRAFRTLGRGDPRDRTDLERLGFHACVADLEDEFIRAIGVAGIEQIIERDGELAAFRSLQRQPAQRDRSTHQQLHRFIGTKSMRKIRYGHLLADAVDLDRIPLPLAKVLGVAVVG